MIECIPNFSEGRRPEVIAAIADAVRAVPGAYVLDTHIDADHHRSVITFAGGRAAVGEASFRAVELAARLIDMNVHQGQHPRIGATDVLPFVPLRGATISDCVELARVVGQRIGRELGIPVYLYGAAAARPERQELPALRRGDYEGLRDSIARDAARAPDYGPAMLGSAGATVVGAREPLIAYNLFLNTADVAIARRIAKAVRGSSGGLRGVRALGMLVNGQAQVSMNLTDYRNTPAHRVVEMVVREAAQYGVAVTSGELVGLIPEDALIDAGKVSLRLPALRDGQILERRLAQLIGEQTIGPNTLLSQVLHTFAAAVRALAYTSGDAAVSVLEQELAALAAHTPESGVAWHSKAQSLASHAVIEAGRLNTLGHAGASAQAQVVVHLAHALLALMNQ